MLFLKSRRVLWIATALAAVALAGGAYAAPQSGAKSADTHTIHLTEASPTPNLTVVDLDPPGLSPGDQVVTTDGVLDRHGDAAGTFDQVCTLVTPGANLFASTFDCIGTFEL